MSNQKFQNCREFQLISSGSQVIVDLDAYLVHGLTSVSISLLIESCELMNFLMQ